ncbi:hypothetical protein A7U60_g4495 [Sanghuangporus baumii]|uniref:Uncharacterized protein n=1 Tax=Sanghuangporus baumii TaxID=108892 RepID=A0A9Q5HYP1_SANBA|nr:hypothetical protein A7U60_g4495 [Sanghuangporus baumii]
MPDFNPLFAPLLLPLPLPVININEGNENNLGPFPGAPQALLQWAPWPEVHFGVQITGGAALNHGLLTPPLTPHPQFLDDVQEVTNAAAHDFALLDDIQDDEFVQDIPVFNNVGIEEVPDDDEFIYGPLDPMVIEVSNAQEPGQVGFDIDLLFDEFHAIFDEKEDENGDFAYEENAHAGIIINGLFYETMEEEEGSDDGDDMELDEVDSLL